MWRGILGHDAIVDRFRRTMRRGRLASTYLFVGPQGIGKKRFSLELAKAVLCSAAAADLEPCGHCESCRLFAAGNHPDLEIVGLLPGKSELAISQFIGDALHRNQDGLCHRLALRPFLGGRRVAIINDADHFNQASANCLLKTLEEPPPRSLLILIGTSVGRQLPTIRSRAQIVPFRPLAPAELQQILLADQIAADAGTAARLAESSGGSVARARELADPELWQFRETLAARLARPAWDLLAAEKAIQDFVQAAGTEASLRRDRLRTVIGFFLDLYREQLEQGAGSREQGAGNREQGAGSGEQGAGSRKQGAGSGEEDSCSLSAPRSSPRRISDLLPALDACLAAVEQVDRNANQSLIISQWLGQLAAPRRSPAALRA
jgi:DNA polymerase-3 subunit delta'